jgi:pimeloyl-ACP methyl ester carboxylesterase
MLLALGLLFAAPALAGPPNLGPLVCRDDYCRGYISVPLDHSGRAPGHVELFVSAILPKGPSRGTVFLLAGGPGQSSSYSFGGGYSLWQDYTQVIYDNRGTGQSSRIACGPFGGGADYRADVARCNDLLGPERAFYSTRDSAADMEAIRRALGLSKVTVWGTSYGTMQALAYAQIYPASVDRLLLDSPLLPTGPDIYNTDLVRSVPHGLANLCAGGACARATADPAGDIAAVANALAAKPLETKMRITSASGTTVKLDAWSVISLAIRTDASPTIASTLPSALAAARAGRPALLQRLSWFANGDSFAWPDHTDAFSGPVFVATMCDDAIVPWAVGTPIAARQGLLDAAIAALPGDAFGTFGSWMAHEGIASDCVGWESTGLNPLASSPFPDVPVLIISGDRDIRTPTENATAVAKLFPRAHVLVVHGAGHSVLGASECADEAAADWLSGDDPPSECANEERRYTLPAIPASVALAKPLKPGGKVGKTLAAVVATLDELIAYYPLQSPGLGETKLYGLVGGLADYDGLKRYSDVPGVELSGPEAPLFFAGRLKIKVTGSASAHGTLRIDNIGRNSCRIRGALGGKPVAATC